MMVMVPSVEPSSEFVRCMFFFWIITDGYCLVPINDRRLFQFISPAWLKEIRSSSPVFMGKTPWFPVDFPFNQSIDKPWFSLMFSFQSSIQWWMCRQVSLSRTGNLVPGFLWCRHISPYTCDSSGTWSWKNRQILFPRFQRRFFFKLGFVCSLITKMTNERS